MDNFLRKIKNINIYLKMLINIYIKFRIIYSKNFEKILSDFH